MNKTRNVTITTDKENLLKTIYAESACLLLTDTSVQQPDYLCDDNRQLLEAELHNALLRLAAEIAPAIDEEAFDPSDAELRLPLRLPEKAAPATRIRLLTERYLCDVVLADCYRHSRYGSHFEQTMRRDLSALRLATSGISGGIVPSWS